MAVQTAAGAGPATRVVLFTEQPSFPLKRRRHPNNIYLWLYQGILVSYRVLNQSRDRKKHILCILNLSLRTIGLLLDRFTFFLQLAYYSGKLGW